jgi:hypothetical protein
VAPYSSSLKQGEKCILPIATDIFMFVKHLALLGEKTDNVAIMCPTYKFNINHTRIAMATAAYDYGSHVLKNQAKHEINQLSFGEIF